LKFHHFIENFNTQSLLPKMNDDKTNVNAAQQLIDAIEKNDIATASSLISSGSVNLSGNPLPLHHAAFLGRVEIMTMLLDAGADINAADHNRHAACFFAIKHDQFDALKLLVERGANLDVVDSNGDSLLATVAQYGKSERIAIFMLDAGAPLDGLLPYDLMTLVKSVAVFNRLIARGVNLTAMRDDLGYNLCHHMASNVTSEDDFRFLVNVCGNDAVHAEDILGKTPLHWASPSRNDSAVRVLVELGADIDRQDHGRQSALANAAANAHSPSVELLIALGADVSLVDKRGEQRATSPRCGESLPLCVLLSRQEAILSSVETTVKLLEWLLLARMLPCQLLTRSKLRANESPRLDSIWFANVHSKSVLDFIHSISTRCNCAKS
jgi:ankyrin repeat protein